MIDPEDDDDAEADAERGHADDDSEGDGDPFFDPGPDEVSDGIESYAEGADGF